MHDRPYSDSVKLIVLGLVTVMMSVLGMLLFFAGVMLHSTRGMLLEMRRSLIDRLAREVQVR